MPYIKEEDRDKFYICKEWQAISNTTFVNSCETPGELNYLITTMLQAFLVKHGESYNTYNSIIGVLECAKLEYYRRQIAVYEKKKCEENGDVF